MSTATQTQTAASSFGRRRFPHLGLSPPKAVVNIIGSKRHASTADLNATNTGTTSSTGGDDTGGSSHPGGAAPKQRRTVSAPLTNDKSNGDSDPEDGNNAPATTSATGATSPPPLQYQASKTSSPTPSSGGGGFHHHLTFPHVAKIFVKLRRVQKKVKAHHIDSSSGSQPQTHSSLLNADGSGLVPEVTRKLARLEIQEEFVCLDGVDVEKLLRASRLALLEHASPLGVNVLVDEQWTSSICGPKHRSDGSFRVHIRYAATAATLSPPVNPPSNSSPAKPSSGPSSSSNASPSSSATTNNVNTKTGNTNTNKDDQNDGRKRERRDSSRRDSKQPIALEKACGVPGLMTIASRETVALSVVSVFEGVEVTTTHS